MRTPVGPHGAHEREQHGPPHVGRPASVYVMVPPLPQTVPSIMLHCAPPAVGCEHVPKMPLVMVQMPPQQSEGAVQMSPFWLQNEGCAQIPDSQ
jgi:hypothetical protein